MCPGRKTKKDPTKEMGREEALEQIGKKKEILKGIYSITS